jgi:protein SCO1
VKAARAAPSSDARPFLAYTFPRCPNPGEIAALSARSKFAVILLALVAAALLAYGLEQRSREFALALEAGTVLPEPRPLPEFALLDHHGRPFGPSRLAGQWTLVFVGFTHCPDICPATLAILAGLDEQLQAEGVEVQMLFVSVDPERDNPATLAQYVAHFSPRLTGATGDKPELDTLMQGLGFAYIKVPLGGGNYTVDHSAALALVDPRGRVAAYFTPPLRPAALAADLAVVARPRR